MNRWLAVICSVCLLVVGRADDGTNIHDVVHGAVAQDPMPAGQSEAFALAVARDFDGVKLRLIDLKLGDDLEAASAAAKLLQHFDQRWAPHAGEERMGIKVRWWVELHGDHLVYTPLVIEVSHGSVAEQSGIRVGDVVETVNGVPLKGDVAPLRLLTVAAMWPVGRPMQLSVRRQIEDDSRSLNMKARGEAAPVEINFDGNES